MLGGSCFDEVLKFKVPKDPRVRRRSRLTDIIPARPVAVVADSRTRSERIRSLGPPERVAW
jgi:hypothetical protein